MSESAIMLLITGVLVPVAGAVAYLLRAKARQIEALAEIAAQDPQAKEKAKTLGVDVSEPLERATRRLKRDGYAE